MRDLYKKKSASMSKCRTVRSRFLIRCAQILLIMSLTGFFETGPRAQVIYVHVVDGRNGHPIPNERPIVFVYTDRGSDSVFTISAGKDGVAELDLGKTPADFVQVSANHTIDCRPGPKHATGRATTKYSMKDILQTGIATENTCGKIKLSPKPGEVIFFVRPMNWFERLESS